MYEQHYISGTTFHWTGRDDGIAEERIYQCIQGIDLQKTLTLSVPKEKPVYALLGFMCDEGVIRNKGRAGAKDGPHALRQRLASLPMPQVTLFDAGDVRCDDADLETAQQALGYYVARLLANHITPIVIGGGHETAWGHYQGLAQQAKSRLGIINFDAHFDLRPLINDQLGSSGTPFLQIAHARQAENLSFDYCCLGIQPGANTASLFNTAKQWNVKTLLAEQLMLDELAVSLASIEEFIARQDQLYITFCLDVLAHSIAPGVSAPQAFGLQCEQILPLLKYCIQSKKMLSLDIVELSPPLDCDQQTAQFAAHLVWYVLSHALPNQN